MKSSWQAIEFARTAFHARDDAKRLYEKVNHLRTLTEKIGAIIQEHDDPFDEEIVSFVQNAIEASNRTLDELARRCHKLGDKEDLSLFVRVPHSVSYTLSVPSIQKFEHQVQTSIISLQFALYLLDRGKSQDLNRRNNDLLVSIKTALDRNTHLSPPKRDESTLHHLDGLSTNTEPVELYKELAVDTIMESRLSPSSSMQTCSVGTDEIPGSPMELLTSQETSAWGEIRQRSESSSPGRRRTKSANSFALIAAINEHSLYSFQQLLDEGVSVNGTDDKGLTPLMHTICQHGDCCNDCMHYMHKLLQFPVNLDASVNGVTALHMAVRYNCLDAAKVLLEKGAEVDSSSPDTPLLLAVRYNRVAFVDLLLAKGADVHVSDEAQWSLIHQAVWRKSVEALVALIEISKALDLRVDLDARNDVGWTPLMLLAERAQLPWDIRLAKILLKNGADVNAVDDSGNPALFYAIKLHSASPERNKFVHFLVEERKANKQLLPAKLLRQAMSKYSALRPSTSTQAT